MAGKTGRFAIMEQFLADEIHYMFGNPGTVEQGFLDVLEDYPDLKYILTLQETVAVAMADGYARATKKPTIVQLHSGVGLGNGVGMLYQAKRGHAPLVVINGDAGIRYDAMDAQMAADLVAIAEPVTKWATRVVDPILAFTRVAPRYQDSRHTANGASVCLSANGHPRCPKRGSNRSNFITGNTGSTRAGADYTGRGYAGCCSETDDYHGRWSGCFRCAGRIDPRGGTDSARRSGGRTRRK